MAKFLDKVIQEMESYDKMGMPTGETGMGMGDSSAMDKTHLRKAYRLSDILRHRNAAEEEEFNDMNATDDEMDSDFTDENGYEDMDSDVEELKQFFLDNPEPSDDEIAMYAEEHGMDLQEMRKAVYKLIQSLMDVEEVDDDNEFDFNVDNGGEEDDFNDETDMNDRFRKNY